MSQSLSLCVIARDEEQLLPGLLKSVAGVAHEVIVGVDTRTKDWTAAVAREHGARVLNVEWQDSFAAARNSVLRKARRDWILTLDADDRLTPWGAAQIKEALRRPRQDVDAYGLQIENRTLDGMRLSVDPLPSVRLFRNHEGIQYVNRVHEVLKPKHGELRIGWLRGDIGILHYGYDPTLYAERAKDKRNIDLLLMQFAEKPDDRLLMYELARQHVIGHRYEQARVTATRALAMPGYLRPELLAELERIRTLALTGSLDTMVSVPHS